MVKKIFIDPGHGGSDPGAVKGIRSEKNDVLTLSLLIAKALEMQDVEVILSRTDDSAVPGLGTRIQMANEQNADYYLSIHRNSAVASATGNEVWVIRTAAQNTVLKARAILDAVCKVDNQVDRGVKKGAPSYGDFAVNRDTKMPSALLELGFISNEKDNAVFDNCLHDYAGAIAKALCEVVGVVFQDSPSIAGDVDGDGIVTANDARTALRAAVKLDMLTEQQKAAADIDGDGVVTAADARWILRKSAGLE